MLLERFIDGAVLGMLMASVFITVSMISLFLVLKNRREQMMPVMEKYPPMTLAMGIVAVSYPTWAVIGGILALLYRVSLEQAPRRGYRQPQHGIYARDPFHGNHARYATRNPIPPHACRSAKHHGSIRRDLWLVPSLFRHLKRSN